MKVKEELDDKRERERERDRDADRDRERDRDRDRKERSDKDRDRDRERDRDRRDSGGTSTQSLRVPHILTPHRSQQTQRRPLGTRGTTRCRREYHNGHVQATNMC